MTFAEPTVRRRLLDWEAAAEYLGVSHHWLRHAVRDRSIPYTKIGRHVRFDIHDLDVMITENRQAPVNRAGKRYH